MHAAHSQSAWKFKGSSLLASGFRPTFLAAGIAASLLIPLWALIWTDRVTLPGYWPPTLWHAHEMVFGFVAVAIAGFLLAAVPSWTGDRGFSGAPLAILLTLWLSARVLVATSVAWLATVTLVIDVAFLVLLGILVAPPLLRASNRNKVLLIVLALLAACNATFHWALAHQNPPLAFHAILVAIDIVLLLVTVIGGRIVPAFTGNALRAGGSALHVGTLPGVGPAAIAVMIGIVLVDLFGPDTRAAGVLAAVAAVVHALRMVQWRSMATLRSPIVWILHLAYVWLPIGLVLKALALLSGLALAAFWLHALTIGALATMILGVMSRAALGHTGRPLIVDPAVTLGYLLLFAAALIRVFGLSVLRLPYPEIVVASATCWTLAFGIFLYIYAPVLSSVRVDGKPG